MPIAMVALKLIAPCNVTIGPAAAGSHALKGMLMGTHATEVARDVGVSLNATKAGRLTEIGTVPPSDRDADAHPVSEKVPDVPFAQQDPIAAELGLTKDCSVIATCRGGAGDIRPLKVRAEKNRSGCVGIAGQESFWAPDK